MNFSNRRNVRKALCLLMAGTLTAALFTGCFGSSDDSQGSLPTDTWGPNLSETTGATTQSTEPQETQLVNENTGTVTAQKVVRIRPTQDSEVNGTLYPGDRVEIIERREVAGYSWGYITSPAEGWITLDYIEMDITESTGTEPTTATTPEETTGTQELNLKGVISGNGVNIRAEPNGEIVGGYNKGDVVTILELSDGWGRTSRGWINMDYVNTSGTGTETNTGSGTETNTGTGTETNTGTSGNGSTTVVAKGIVTASELNIRSQASTDSDRVGSLTYGDRVNILEKSGSWGRIKDGWIHLDYVYQDGTKGTNTAAGIVTASELNIRGGPGTGYDPVGSYSTGARVNILEQFTYNDVTWGCTDKGWISLDYVYIDGTGTGNDKKATITGDNLNIRSGPGTGYTSVGKLDSGDRVTILYEVTVGDTTWGNIKEGWISMDYVDLG